MKILDQNTYKQIGNATLILTLTASNLMYNLDQLCHQYLHLQLVASEEEEEIYYNPETHDFVTRIIEARSYATEE
ncbi:hypothetical protein [Portibacter lacus]|uniref:Uncharacterized protein n=1 Tax=Portibacter lacus TaxID=1099794 RepID=A0AA37ST53_9BACT|nr:hypothetical protein [Portibacter lacus]GLR19672.1 hypothetical protein GCM10007940_42880 [Portibacter lacus]